MRSSDFYIAGRLHNREASVKQRSDGFVGLIVKVDLQ